MIHCNVVYKIHCRDCDATYVGQTKRATQLITKIKEHKSNIKAHSDLLSEVSNHRLSGHEFNWDDIFILDKECTYRKRLISEMLHICSQENKCSE